MALNLYIVTLASCVLIASCQINQITVYNMDKFCINGECKGLYYGSFERVLLDQTKKFSFPTVKFTNSSFRVIPTNLFRVFTAVRELHMENCDIKKVERINFDAGQNLRLLDLSYNQIEELPTDGFNILRVLTNLTLIHNGLRIMYPTTLNGLSTLKNLSLAYNEITEFPTNFFQYTRQLEHIDLSYNTIEKFEDNIFTVLVNLRNLILTGNKMKIININIVRSKGALMFMYNNFNASTVVTTTKCFANQNNNLNLLDLSRNYIGYVDIQMFIMLTKLKVLNISATDLFYIEVGALSHHSYLEVLDVTDNHLVSIALETILPLKTLNKLYIDNNNLTQIDYRHFLSYINLTEIGVGGNLWNCSYLREMVHYVQSANCSLRKDTRFLVPQMQRNTTGNIEGVICMRSQDTSHKTQDTTHYASSESIFKQIRTATETSIATHQPRVELNVTSPTQSITEKIFTSKFYHPTKTGIVYTTTTKAPQTTTEPPVPYTKPGLLDFTLNFYVLTILLITSGLALLNIYAYTTRFNRVRYDTSSSQQEMANRFI